MSDVDIAAIREALAKATPGPWEPIDEEARVLHAFGMVTYLDGCSNEDAELIVLLRNNAEALLRDRDIAVQALWDVYAALGFDTDGDKTPAARLGDGVKAFARRVVAAAAEHRRDTEADYDRDLADAERVGAAKALRDMIVGTDRYEEQVRLSQRADAIESGSMWIDESPLAVPALLEANKKRRRFARGGYITGPKVES